MAVVRCGLVHRRAELVAVLLHNLINTEVPGDRKSHRRHHLRRVRRVVLTQFMVLLPMLVFDIGYGFLSNLDAHPL